MCEPAKPGSGIGFMPVAVLLSACLIVSAFGWVLTTIGIGLAVGAVALAAGFIFLTLRHYHRWLESTRVPAWQRIGHIHPQPQVTARQVPQFPARQRPVVDSGQHLHLHLGGLTPAERAEAIRQLRGGQS
jgi:hypothetical protein